MKNGRSLVELATELERQNEAKHDVVAPVRALRVDVSGTEDDPDLTLAIGDEGTYGINHVAHAQMSDRFKVPRKYYERMRTEAPALLADNLNHWIQASPPETNRLVRTMDGTARALLSDRYLPLDNNQLAEVALPVLTEKRMEVISAQVTDTRLYIKAVDHSMAGKITRQGHEFTRSDEVHWGVVISNSEVGFGALKLQTFYFTVYCSNAAIVEMKSRRQHVGQKITTNGHGLAEVYTRRTQELNADALFAQMGDELAAATSAAEFEAVLLKLQGATERKLEGDPAAAVEVLQTKLGLTDGERGGVLRHLIEGGDLSAWGVSSAVTRMAEDVDSYDRATVLEELGHSVIELAPAQWKEVAAAA